MNQLATKEDQFNAYEKALLGDLSKLTSKERIFHMKEVCESLKLNPLTRPFQYIILDGKMTLYATKDATDQLRKINSVSIIDIQEKIINGVLVVTVKAADKEGRIDTDIGAVNIEGLKGNQLANGYMKAYTKAKRRVTLSISGAGIVDESELETIPKNLIEIVELPQSDEELALILMQYNSMILACKVIEDLRGVYQCIIKEIREKYKDDDMIEVVTAYKDDRKKYLESLISQVPKEEK